MASEPIAQLDGAGNIVARFVYGSDRNTPSFMIKNGETYRIISDHTGSPRVIVHTGTGAIMQQLDYDEYGNVTTDTNTGFQPFGFMGGLLDRDTGLVTVGPSSYDAEVGRTTARDSSRVKDRATELSGHVVDDPANLSGPSELPYGDPRTYVNDAFYYWVGFFGGVEEFLEAYSKLLELNLQHNLIGTDRFMHCMANCMAYQHGPGGEDAAGIISEGRELWDEYAKGYPRSDCDADRRANEQGRAGPSDCAQRCASLKPPLLPWP